MARQIRFKRISNKQILLLYDTSIKRLWNISNNNLFSTFEKWAFLQELANKRLSC